MKAFSAIVIFSFGTAFSQNADLRILNKANVHRNQRWDPVMGGVTQSVVPITISSPIIYAGSAILSKDSNAIIQSLAWAGGIGLNTAITLGLKYSINRSRPYDVYPELNPIHTERTPSFPSGHSSNAFATATALTLAIPKWYVAAPAYAWAIASGYSRLHRGVHYPTDVLAGAAIGTCSALISQWFTTRVLCKRCSSTQRN